MTLHTHVRAIEDYPKPGITFRDLTPLMGNAAAFGACVDQLAGLCEGQAVDLVAGIEARGFVFGAALARRLDAGFVPIRKPGKLPGETLSQSYALEYGEDTLEVHADAAQASDRVLLLDDLLATGGTACAAAALLDRLGVKPVAAVFAVELDGLPGRERLEALGLQVHSLMRFPA